MITNWLRSVKTLNRPFADPAANKPADVADYVSRAEHEKVVKKYEDELREARAAAEEALRAKAVFLSTASHEIRTPMNSIIGFSELALNKNLSRAAKDDYINKIRLSAEGLTQIINDILDATKIEAGKIELDYIPFNLHDVFKICQIIMAPKAMAKGITLYFYAEPSIGRMILGDPMRLRQAILNLLSNAVKFTHTGIVKLMSAIENTSPSTVTIRFEVKDSGIGMTQEQIQRIFESFTQADNSTSRQYGGIGLGLTITKNIIEIMGGKLNVQSVVDVGSKFSFTLTFNTIDSPSDISGSEMKINEYEIPSFIGEVLLCEDNEMNRQVIRDHLALVGIDAISAKDGKECVEIVIQRRQKNEKPFDLILMDVHMPVMDGLEAASILKQSGITTPIVALTANIMSNELEVYKAYGMQDYLAKPFTQRDLWACLIKYLSSAGGSAPDKNEQAKIDTKRRIKLYADFVRNNQNTFKQLTDAVDSGDFKLAHRLSHTLKSHAALIERTRLYDAARAIEYSLSGEIPNFTAVQMDTLKLELNAALDELTHFAYQPELSSPPLPPLESRGKLRILVVDDDIVSINIMLNILSPLYDILVAKDGYTAIKIAHSQRPNLILLDVVMPGLSGFETLARLKQSELTRTIPVALVTGLDDCEDVATGQELGAAMYINKPLHSETILKQVKLILQNEESVI